jgi:hypothetical protein
MFHHHQNILLLCFLGIKLVSVPLYASRDLDTCFQKGSKYCLNGCNGRGQCTGGFCYCEPGKAFLAECHMLFPGQQTPVPQCTMGTHNYLSQPQAAQSPALRHQVVPNPCVPAHTAGFWGTDCSLSVGPDGKPELLAGFGYTQRSKPPKIYVYELPGHCNM